MIVETNKQKGNAGLSLAIAYYGSNGYTVSIPLNDTQDYDLIIDDGDSLKKVQVKFTGSASNNKNNEKVYEVAIKSCGGTKGTVYKRVRDTNIDILFVVCDDLTLYEIPKEYIVNSSTISLRKTKNIYSNIKIDYSQFIVTI